MTCGVIGFLKPAYAAFKFPEVICNMFCSSKFVPEQRAKNFPPENVPTVVNGFHDVYIRDNKHITFPINRQNKSTKRITFAFT